MCCLPFGEVGSSPSFNFLPERAKSIHFFGHLTYMTVREGRRVDSVEGELEGEGGEEIDGLIFPRNRSNTHSRRRCKNREERYDEERTIQSVE